MSRVQNLLVLGGLGYVGSNTLVELYESTAANIIIIDDFSNCFDDVLTRVFRILSVKYNPEDIQKRISMVKGNILDLEMLDGVFKEQVEKKHPIDGIMHFAAKKAVGESMENPLMYYENNLVGSMNLFKMMEKYEQCTNFIFSSTAAIYGEKDNCSETDPKNPISPYAESKTCVEMLMKSLTVPHKNWRMIALRYFNPVGSHESGEIGDDPSVYPNNLAPVIQEVILGKRQMLKIFGNDYATPDGTGVRDYIHITDLARAHIKALEKINSMEAGIEIFNIGTGKGYSVLELLSAFEKALGRPIKYEFTGRRAGDLTSLVANVEKANKYMNWKAEKTILDIARDSVKFLEVKHGLKMDQKEHVREAVKEAQKGVKQELKEQK